MAVVHVRVGGWCDLCGGLGKAKIEHVDGTERDAAVEEARQVLATAVAVIAASARARLVELEAGGRGCENAAERRFEEGRLQVVEHDLWQAVGLTPVGEDGPPGLVDVPLPGL